MRRVLLSLLLLSSPAFGLSSPPSIEACDYRFTSGSPMKSDTCRVDSSFNMGIIFLSISPVKESMKFKLWTNPSQRESNTAEIVAGTNIVWEGTFTSASDGVNSQCRPGGYGATKYTMNNGGFVCLYSR